MSTQFACPSPSGRNIAQLFLNERGHLIDGKTGAYWGRSSMRRLAQDALPPDLGTGEKKPVDWAKSNAMATFRGDVQKFCNASGMSMEEHQAFLDAINEHLSGENEADRGKGAIDDDKSKAATDDDEDDDEDDDAAVEQRVRELLASKGLDSETIEEALKRVKADRAEAKDRLPVPGPEGRGGHLSGRSKHDDNVDLSAEYGPGFGATVRDTLGELDPNRGEPGYRASVYRAGLAAARELPGGGVSRRLSNDAAFRVDDAEMAEQYGEGWHTTREGAFG
jgi:hypothetical protein